MIINLLKIGGETTPATIGGIGGGGGIQITAPTSVSSGAGADGSVIVITYF